MSTTRASNHPVGVGRAGGIASFGEQKKGVPRHALSCVG